VSVSLQYIKGNILRALAVTSPHRLKSLPDVPTFAERRLTGSGPAPKAGGW